MLIPAMKKVANDTGARFVPSVELTDEEMWHDGIHLRPAGAKKTAKAIRRALRPRAATHIVKRPQASSKVSTRNQKRALDASVRMGKDKFFAMSRVELLSWVKKYCITTGVARKEEMAKRILAKIDSKWRVD